MTWEWALIITVPVVCVSVVFSIYMLTHKNDPSEDVVRLENQLLDIKGEFEDIRRLGEETQKMLSQAHLARSLGGRR